MQQYAAVRAGRALHGLIQDKDVPRGGRSNKFAKKRMQLPFQSKPVKTVWHDVRQQR